MEGSNRSGLQCFEHPRQQFTNFCVNIECLKPLCPDCVETHTKLHSKQEIQSWKHTTTKAAMKIKQTLDELRSIFELTKQMRNIKTPQTIESQNLHRLSLLREKYHRMVDQIFNTHQNYLRTHIRQQYRYDQPDTSKLKMAIEEIQKVLMKLAHPNSVLPALKKALLLDQNALVGFFGHLRNPKQNVVLEHFFSQSGASSQGIKNGLEQCVQFQLAGQGQGIPREPSPDTNRRYSNHISVGQWADPFDALRITSPDYFLSTCKNKNLHFFVPCSFQLKILKLQQLDRPSWRTIQFKAKKELPCYFKSIAVPNGDLYLSGGSQQELRCREIFKYSYERNSLDFVANMLQERSSHSICHLDNKIYLIGGFSGPEGDVTRECEVLDLQTMICTRIAPLNTPSANSAAAAFGGQFIFKFGGILNKNQGNSLIEMYSVKNNRWIVVGINTPKNNPPLDLLSFSAAVQINEKDILVFGGYDNSELEKTQRLCYALSVNVEKNMVTVKNYNANPLPYAEGFWNNNPIIHGRRVVGLQNITDQENELTAIADERRVVIFNGQQWL